MAAIVVHLASGRRGALDSMGGALFPAASFLRDGKVRLSSWFDGEYRSVREPRLMIGGAACFEWFRFIADSMVEVGWGSSLHRR